MDGLTFSQKFLVKKVTWQGHNFFFFFFFFFFFLVHVFDKVRRSYFKLYCSLYLDKVFF